MREEKWTAGPEMDFLLMETLGVAIERVRNRKDVAAEGGVGGPGCGASLGLWSDILAHLEAADRYYRRHSAAPDLAEALEPFARVAAVFDEYESGGTKFTYTDDHEPFDRTEDGHRIVGLTVGHLRAARAALSKAGGLAGAPHD